MNFIQYKMIFIFNKKFLSIHADAKIFLFWMSNVRSVKNV